MNRSDRYAVLFLIILLAGGVVRFVRPELRPMHTDESVNAHKLGALLESGHYRYDRREYHGPVLYYSGLAAARLKGEKTHALLSESTLRGVTAFYGLLIPVLLLFLVREAKWVYVLVTASLAALAPGLLFYSRYYIHEILLVFFSFAFIISGYRCLMDRKTIWLVLTGVFMGLMHATKETCVINYAACALALPATIIIKQRRETGPVENRPPVRILHLVAVFLVAAVVSAMFYSSFFSNPQGIIDSFTTYALYFKRAGMDDAHLHPWYYYLSLWFPRWEMDRFTGTEMWLPVTGVVGFILLMIKRSGEQPGKRSGEQTAEQSGERSGEQTAEQSGERSGEQTAERSGERSENLLLFIGFYTFILLVIYSAVPYKTPWNILQFYAGMIFLSGYGIIRIIGIAPWKWLKAVLAILLVTGGIHWVWTGMQLNFKYFSEPRNPYVYAHTGSEIPKIAARIDSIGFLHPDGHNLAVEVVFPENDYWPLPWYLRKFPNTGFYSEVDPDAPAAPVIVIHPSLEKELIRKLYEVPPPGERHLYVPLYGSCRELRPGVPLCIYIRKNLWDLYQASLQPE